VQSEPNWYDLHPPTDPVLPENVQALSAVPHSTTLVPPEQKNRLTLAKQSRLEDPWGILPSSPAQPFLDKSCLLPGQSAVSSKESSHQVHLQEDLDLSSVFDWFCSDVYSPSRLKLGVDPSASSPSILPTSVLDDQDDVFADILTSPYRAGRREMLSPRPPSTLSRHVTQVSPDTLASHLSSPVSSQRHFVLQSEPNLEEVHSFFDSMRTPRPPSTVKRKKWPTSSQSMLDWPVGLPGEKKNEERMGCRTRLVIRRRRGTCVTQVSNPSDQ
jgi:hypothetical protein